MVSPTHVCWRYHSLPQSHWYICYVIGPLFVWHKSFSLILVILPYHSTVAIWCHCTVGLSVPRSCMPHMAPLWENYQREPLYSQGCWRPGLGQWFHRLVFQYIHHLSSSGQTILLNDRSDRSKPLWSMIDQKANLRSIICRFLAATKQL